MIVLDFCSFRFKNIHIIEQLSFADFQLTGELVWCPVAL